MGGERGAVSPAGGVHGKKEKERKAVGCVRCRNALERRLAIDELANIPERCETDLLLLRASRLLLRRAGLAH